MKNIMNEDFIKKIDSSFRKFVFGHSLKSDGEIYFSAYSIIEAEELILGDIKEDIINYKLKSRIEITMNDIPYDILTIDYHKKNPTYEISVLNSNYCEENSCGPLTDIWENEELLKNNIHFFDVYFGLLEDVETMSDDELEKFKYYLDKRILERKDQRFRFSRLLMKDIDSLINILDEPGRSKYRMIQEKLSEMNLLNIRLNLCENQEEKNELADKFVDKSNAIQKLIGEVY